MPASYVGVTKGSNAADPGRSLPISPVAATLPGDFLIVVFTLASTSVSITPAAGWTTGDTGIGALAAGHRAGIFYKIAVSGDETTTYQFPTSPNQTIFAEAVLYVLRGIDTTTPVLNHAVRNDASSYVTSIPAPALTVNDSGDATFYAYTGFSISAGTGGGIITTLPGTLSNPINQSLAADMSDTIGVGWGTNVTAPGNATTNFTIDYITFGVDLKPAPPPPLTPGGRKFYVGADLGTGLRVSNSRDPINPQDGATKNYTDLKNAVSTPAGGTYWEQLAQGPSAVNNYSGGWANGGGLPPTVTINKLFASTRIRCKIFNVSSWATSVGGNHYWGVAINGGAIQTVTRLFHNRVGIRMAAPFGVTDFSPGGYPQVNTTGPMQVVWYVMTDAGVGWNVDNGDNPYSPTGLISEMP